ncbi:nad binding site : FAD dependent oxidoreductase OS=Isosphaera pallida (strain ATCC 43644 / DSM 9630 / IS1B) GN=Isop_3154 PE=4 SV=1: FAD_binding_3 [Gemmataceae bacterium]|nr:nad binding site : FAD dependent oxidoreductase OS=Isosphaera pallida (strain ATCC 43644 / DSM 9630 / IS1B) GN=Isop_3154 PE=4 SV=1: FAD_binding_3 [Gemmataceae bacterium]VTT97151.1 nad binding site : FAD dependent oxidoreductase OS=Isosphaera pallida (strain ATCC 43644 / DSM 9630 / IS1B) GN=Isop_3154 PE=4 SV=1: FAD_binding_3 [Gemmataceae bacterium]
MTHDTLVIGAGPAGSVTARELARRGRRVLLVDKATFPRPKVCGCCLNGAAVRTLERIGLGHVLAGAIPLDRVRIAGGARSAEVRLPRGVALSREALDVRLIDAAVRSGVEFRPNTTILQRDRGATDVNVTVLASGLTGGGAAPEPGSRIGAGVVLGAASVPAFYTDGTIFMATGRGGYVGLVRVEDGRLDVAAAFDPAFVKSAGGLGPAAEDVLGSAGWPVPSELVGAAWKGTPALTRRPVRVAGERFFAVGDAAGYVEPFTGEGMAWAVMSAAALAPIAARDWQPGLAREWEAAHARVVARRQRVCRVVSRVLRSPQLTGLAVRALALVPGLAVPFTSALNHPAQLPT